MILGFASLQGFVLSALLFFNKNSTSFANKLISLLVFVFSLMLVEEVLEAYELHRAMPKITGSGFLLELFLGPLTWVYASLLSGEKNVSALLKKHLAFPVLANLLFWAYHFNTGLSHHFLFSEELAMVMVIFLGIKISYQVTYQLLSILLLSRFRRQQKTTAGKDLLSLATWVQRILTTVLVLIPLVYLLDAFSVTQPLDSDSLTSIIMIFSIYSVGYLALNYPLVYARDQEPVSVAKAKRKKYSRSALTVEKESQLKQQLLVYMEEEKPFLDPDITAEDLARQMGTDRHHLSQLLNQSLQKGFYEFINAYRVKEFIRRLESADHPSENILSMGFEAGFNSKATFNRAFRKVTGTTPLQYVKSLRK